MKCIPVIVLMLLNLLVLRAAAQPEPRMQKEKMRALSAMTGTWKGSGSMQRGPGEPLVSQVTEQIHYKLDSTVLLVYGLGTRMDPSGKEVIVHEALGVIAYDLSKNAYSFRTYLRNGMGADTSLAVTGENQYQWGFETPQGSVRYMITLDPVAKTWTETGAFSADSTQWNKFFQMKLTKE